MEGAQKFHETINVSVELEPSLMRFVLPEGEAQPAFRSLLLQYIGDLVSDLSIPANISLIIRLGDDTKKFSMTFYHVNINENWCRLQIPSLLPQDVEADELARSVAKGIYQNTELFIPTSLAQKIQKQWSTENAKEILANMPPNIFHDLLLEFVRHNFSINRAKEFFQQGGGPIIEQMIEPSGAPKQVQVPEKWDAKRSFEECISDWSALKIRVLLPNPSSLNSEARKGQQAKNETKIENMLELMQDGLFYELGVIVPKVTHDIDNGLKEGEFRIQMNDLKFPPIQGLEQGYFMVNDTVERLSLIKITGKSFINPANESECAVVLDEKRNREVCEEAGLTTWGSEDFIILTLAAKFRRNAAAFLTTKIVEYSIDQLRRAFPALVDAAQEHYDMPELSCILRTLLEEEFSIRDLHGILENLIKIHALMRNQYFDPEGITDGQSINNLDRCQVPQFDRSKQVELLRIAFKRYLSVKYVARDNVLVAFLLDPETERRISNADEQLLKPESDNRMLIKAIYDNLDEVPLTSMKAFILTTVENRKRLRNLIVKEFPWLAILCYQELAPDLNIQPISRITLPQNLSGGIL